MAGKIGRVLVRHLSRTPHRRRDSGTRDRRWVPHLPSVPPRVTGSIGGRLRSPGPEFGMDVDPTSRFPGRTDHPSTLPPRPRPRPRVHSPPPNPLPPETTRSPGLHGKEPIVRHHCPGPNPTQIPRPLRRLSTQCRSRSSRPWGVVVTGLCRTQ